MVGACMVVVVGLNIDTGSGGGIGDGIGGIGGGTGDGIGGGTGEKV